VRRSFVIVILLAAVAVAVLAYAESRPSSPPAHTATTQAPPSAAATQPPAVSAAAAGAGGAPGVPHLAHVFVIVMENHPASDIVGSSSAPYINGLISRSAYAANYSALTHPSLPNYIALTSGDFQGINDDRNPPSAGYAVNAVNLADRLEAAGLTWKAYAQSLPSAGYAQNSGLFVTKHEPFVYYKDILENGPRRVAHVVPYWQLATDLRSAATTPSFAFITPNMYDDMHDGPISAGDRWLSRAVPAILGSRAFTNTPSLLVVTWDEGSASDNHVATIFAGNSVRAGARSVQAYDHYSLLHTIEAALQVQPITANDARAPAMSDLFGL
jgi:phosphatidylinositol-3-phosphatase